MESLKQIDLNGKQIRMEVLFTYDNTEQGLVYIVYTDNTLDDEGNVNTYASYFYPDEDEPRLRVITTNKPENGLTLKDSEYLLSLFGTT